MKYKPPRFKDKELLKIFPEAEEIIPEKIQEYKDAIQAEEKKIQSCLSEIYSSGIDSFSAWMAEEMVKIFLFPDLLALDKQLLRLRRFQPIITPSKNSNALSDEQIEIARNYPIEELAQTKLDLRPSGKNFVSLCPFHDEKTPSFFIFPKDGKFHCFGCREHGDVIKLTMALHGVAFRDAVIMLQN
ncbi:MAG: CHC2 zinc finger domain-containing protein [Candidatus Moranbacteria bacterium]|nr:CHC2 zinc finger domain-containing protein [Candidatus Moranbacteria bacterium]